VYTRNGIVTDDPQVTGQLQMLNSDEGFSPNQATNFVKHIHP